jgi:predicted DNA-binding transcriptional regulator AlpA
MGRQRLARKAVACYPKTTEATTTTECVSMADSNGYGWLTTKQVAGISGLSTAHLHSLRKKGLSPPYHQMGRKVLYRRADIDTWLQTTRHAPADSYA